jgi:3-deoxy-D-manno-octulosonate 8-phosphate phosphatase (KDO 8-P phosphatase)
MQNYRENLKEITTFIFDFDGVLSDGKIYVMGDGEQVRSTNTKDGYALHYALRKGYRVAVISGGYSESMKERYKNFSDMDIFLRVSNKVEVFNQYITEKGIKPDEVLYMGDDIPDYKLMLLVGVKCCPADACEEVKSIADYISYQAGGNGAVRDVIEQTLKAQERWFEEDACIW